MTETAMFQRLDDGHTGWFNNERRWWIGLALATGLIGFAFGNGHTTQNAIADNIQQVQQKDATINRLVTHDIPKIKAIAGCEHVRAKEEEAGAVDGQLPDCPPIQVLKGLGKVPIQPSQTTPK